VIIEGGTRDVGPWVKRNKVKNMDVLPRLIALDVWLANNDRNMGNLLGRQVDDEGDQIELVAIDFEKSATVRRLSPNVEIPTMPPKGFWPRDELGKLCQKTVKFDDKTFDAFRKVTDGQVERAVSAAAGAVGVSPHDSITHVLLKRRDKLKQLIEETCK
jgi:hypothetical protein